MPTADLLPLAIAIALTPFAAVIVLLLLVGREPVAATTGFLLGWLSGIAGVAIVAATLTDVLENERVTPTWVRVVKGLIGVLLIVQGVRQISLRGKDKPPPGFIAGLGEAGFGSSLRLGVLVSAANPKVALLALSAGLSIGEREPAVAQLLWWSTLFAFVAASTGWLPAIVRLVGGRRVDSGLRSLSDALLRNYYPIVGVVLLVIGFVVLLGSLGFR